jgi:DNA-binding NarL/FixJ family response regulator
LKKVLHVLAIDDHVVVLEGYHAIFKNLDVSYTEVKFTKASDCKSGYEIIDNHKANPFDIAIVDYSIPQFPEMNLHSGEDMALLLRESMPNCKIVMMTMHKEVDIMSRILQKINPEGFINKSDCTSDELIDGFRSVLNDNTYYSKTVSNYLKRQEKGIMLEDLDIKILLLLAKGIKNKNLGKYIPLSDSGIEKRKYRIKRLLDVEGNDEDLISEARSQGYI